ncbi:hypothetical protein FHR22_004082 [Sphingopyxis panaciterrae]|uniref:hypothetical protein n=1 Tax=Sphingopyxis panaciterrae TaxID=363841 RepID=UPI00142422E1|nr:hypothetical protein [Sphingopyxis panaciterrae]NIJ39335.1 hypothetical protein [Sphingopyxis panaciterrae]
MANLSGDPRLVARRCGGWLALSGHENPIKIGVCGKTETAALENFRKSISAWKADIDADVTNLADNVCN